MFDEQEKEGLTPLEKWSIKKCWSHFEETAEIDKNYFRKLKEEQRERNAIKPNKQLTLNF